MKRLVYFAIVGAVGMSTICSAALPKKHKVPPRIVVSGMNGTGMIGASAGGRTGNAVSPDEKAVGEEVKKMFRITTKAKKLSAPAVAKILDKGAGLYNVEVRISSPDGSTGIHKIMVVKQGSAITQFSEPSTNQKCPELQKMISRTFKLKSEADAKTLEAAIDVLDPISDAFGGKDKKAKKIIKNKDGFTLIRGEFFRKLKGYIFKTDNSGAIVDVSYSLEIK